MDTANNSSHGMLGVLTRQQPISELLTYNSCYCANFITDLDQNKIYTRIALTA